MAGNIVVSQINGGSIGVINAIINGNFGINQRGVSGTVTLAAGAYGHDRWKAGASGCTYTFATTNNVTTLTISSGSLIQVIEGLNLFDGTYTLSWTGTAQGKIGAGSYAGSGVTGAAVGGTNLNIEFNTGTVSLVQFEQGSVATPFERRPYGTELSLCQRYYQFLGGTADQSIGSGISVTSSQSYSFVPFICPMRTAPSVSFSSLYFTDSSSYSSTISAIANSQVGTNSMRIGLNSAATMTALRAGMLSASATGGGLSLSSEL